MIRTLTDPTFPLLVLDWAVGTPGKNMVGPVGPDPLSARKPGSSSFYCPPWADHGHNKLRIMWGEGWREIVGGGFSAGEGVVP